MSNGYVTIICEIFEGPESPGKTCKYFVFRLGKPICQNQKSLTGICITKGQRERVAP